MAKAPVLETVSSGYQSEAVVNNNNDNIEAAFDNTLSLDGSSPNAMQADLDMNSNDLLNTDKGYFQSIYLQGSLLSASTSLSSLEGTRQFATVTAMKAATDLTLGQFVFCAGYHTIGDAGHGYYLVVASEPSHEGKEQITAGNWAEMISDAGGVSVKRFGAKGDGTNDDTTAINNAILYAEDAGSLTVLIPLGTYRTTATINMQENVHIVMEGGQARDQITSRIVPDNGVTIAFDANELDGFRITGLVIDMQNMGTSTVGIRSRSNWNGLWIQCAVYNGQDSTNIGWYLLSEVAASQGHYWNTFISCTSKHVAGTCWAVLGQSVGDTRMTTIFWLGCQAHTGTIGVSINYAGSGLIWQNGSIENMTSDGVVVDNITSGNRFNIHGHEITGNGGYGINAGTDGWVFCTQMTFSSNTSGNFNDPNGTIKYYRSGVMENNQSTGLDTSEFEADRYLTQQYAASYDGSTALPSYGSHSVQGDGGAATFSGGANPQILAPTGNKSMSMFIRGASDTNTLTFVDGAGLLLKTTSITLGANDVLWLVYDSILGSWTEVARNVTPTQTYTITGDSTLRTINVPSATLANVANVLSTLIRDLGEEGKFNIA